MKSWEDDRQDELNQEFPGWQVWYIRSSVQRQNTWCARPEGAPVAVFHAFGPAELAQKIKRALDADKAEGRL